MLESEGVQERLKDRELCLQGGKVRATQCSSVRCERITEIGAILKSREADSSAGRHGHEFS